METKQICSEPKLWFIAHNPESDRQIFFDVDKLEFHYERRVNELHGRLIHACFHGWVILSDHPDTVQWSLWNPLTSRFIRLPPLITKEKYYYECCLSSPPKDDHSWVFLLFPDEIPTIFLYGLKSSKWTEMPYAKQLRAISGGEDDCLLQRPTCCNGKVYTLALRSYMFVIQVDIVVKGNEVVINLLPFVGIPNTGPLSHCPSNNTIGSAYPFLKGGSCMELFYIQVDFIDKIMKTVAGVHLFKLDMTSKMWKEMVDLQDAVFFIELAGGYLTCYYSCAIDPKIIKGYIHIVGECGKILYSYHVRDKTLSLSSLPCLVQETQASSWAMLEWRLEVDDHVEEEEEEEDKDTEIVVRPNKGEFDVESHLLEMPLHILELIMEFCIGVEYMKFRATCKHCCLAAPLIQWSGNTRLRSYSLALPWLVVLDNYRDTISFIDPMFGDRYFINTPQELKGGYEIYCSRYGWLLMYKIEGEPRLVFFNPFTGDIRELPTVQYMGSFCFSAPPTSTDCMVVGFTKHGFFHVFIHFVYMKSTWLVHDLNDNPYSIHFKFDPYSFYFPTFRGRYIYALCDNKRIEAFRDMTGFGYHWELVADKVPSRSSAQYFLSSCDKHLLLVIVGEFGGSVEVFKLDESTQEWEKVDELGKHMIYISNTSCFCLEAKSPELGNKIYFIRLLHDENTKMVFYSFETCRYHTFDGKNIQESFGADLFGTKQLCFPHAWIEPNWS